MIQLIPAEKNDTRQITEIYNSNPDFLLHHLGVTSVDENFISGEMKEMKQAGFTTCLVRSRETEQILAVIDYKPDITVYLSLLMVDQTYQKKGIGSMICRQFEQLMAEVGCKEIRIDVVNDYEGNVLGFWEKQGYKGEKTICLHWGSKTMKAVVMKKTL